MKRHRHNINTEIAYTHIVTRKRQVLVAALGVTVGISIFIFMNSLMYGFERYSMEALFKTVPHLRVYRDDALSQPLTEVGNDSVQPVILNPKITAKSKKIINPAQVMAQIKALPGITAVTPDVGVNVFFNNGQAQMSGRISGVDIVAEDAMFNLTASMLEGDLNEVETRQNGILIGQGIADKLNLRLEDNLTVRSGIGVVKNLKVVGIFKTGITSIDKTKGYVSISTAQQLLREGPSYLTDIFVNVVDPNKAKRHIPLIEQVTGFVVESWETAKAAAMAANKVRRVMAFCISMSILLVAGFGIYNILNMTIMQKLNDIAILKAMGFSGKSVTRIFVMQALLIGAIGVVLGMGMGTVLVNLLARVYVGGDIGFFPIRFEPPYFAAGASFGILITFLAGYIPARKAAKVDPVAIFRK